MSRREDIINVLTEHGDLTRSDITFYIYGDRSKTSIVYGFLQKMLDEGTVIKIGERPAIYRLTGVEPRAKVARQPQAMVQTGIPLGESIAVKIGRFYDLIRNYQEGGPNTRYKSWEWCHQAFLNNKGEYRTANEDRKNEIVEYLSLHLAFYLASWGMYRGSSYLLQRDYKAHKNAVRIILESIYDLLWDYEPTHENIDTAAELLFNLENGVYYRIKNSYRNYEGNDDDASDTLTTKILMGTFGCVPAFDRFLKRGIGNYNKHYPNRNLTQSIENNGKTFKALANFAIEKARELHFEADFHYPIMKCVDMFFWECGYELDIADNLVKHDVSNTKKRSLLEEAVNLGICQPGLSNEATSEEIKSKN